MATSFMQNPSTSSSGSPRFINPNPNPNRNMSGFEGDELVVSELLCTDITCFDHVNVDLDEYLDMEYVDSMDQAKSYITTRGTSEANNITEVTNTDGAKETKTLPSDEMTSSSPTMTSSTVTRMTDREARLMRYKEKKKNRRFEKTVWYASRKVYAETRPRVKGRFVKIVGHEGNKEDDGGKLE